MSPERGSRALVGVGGAPPVEVSRGVSDAGYAYGYGYGEARERRWRQHLSVLLRHKRVVLLCLTVGWAAGYWKAQQVVPSYEATAVVRVGSGGGGGGALAGLGPVVGGADMLTELELLRSERMARIVADSLELTIQTPSEVRAVLSDAELDADAGAVFVTLVFAPDSYAATDGNRRELARAGYGQPLFLPSAHFLLADRPEGLERAPLALLDAQAAADRVRGGLRARVRGGTEIVDISYTSHDSQLAAAVANMVARLYQQQSEENVRRRARARRLFLAVQLERAEAAYAEAQSELDGFQRQTGILPSTERLNLWLQQTLGLDAEHLRLLSDRDALGSILQSIGDIEPTDAELQALAYAPVLSENAMVQRLYERYLELKDEREALVTGRFAVAESSPDVERLDLMLRSTRQEILAAAHNLIRILDRRIEVVTGSMDHAQEQLGDLPQDAAREGELMRQVGASQAVVEELRGELLRAQIAEVLELGNVDIVDPARVPGSPIRPRGPSRTMLGLLLGTLAGIVAAFGLERLDTTIKDRRDMEAGVGLAGLAVVPRDGSARRWHARGLRRLPVAAVQGGEVQASGALPLRGGRYYGHVAVSEAYRSLRTNLMFSQVVGELKVVVITSASPGEGKTTTALHLASAFAQQGARTLLIDCDLRRPALEDLLGTPREPGLTDVLLASHEPKDAILRIKDSKLFFLPRGREAFNPSEILGSERFRRLIEVSRTSFDMIIIDSPPILPFTDAVVLSAFADGVVVVTFVGKTDRDAAREAVVQLQNVGAHIVGGVVIGARPDRGYYAAYPYAGDYARYDSPGEAPEGT